MCARALRRHVGVLGTRSDFGAGLYAVFEQEAARHGIGIRAERLERPASLVASSYGC